MSSHGRVECPDPHDPAASPFVTMPKDAAKYALDRMLRQDQIDTARVEERRTAIKRLAEQLVQFPSPPASLRDRISFGSMRRLRLTIRRRGLLVDDWYRSQYARVGSDALGHFLHFGLRADRAPNPFFDPAWYAAAHSLPAGGGKAFLHYLEHGSAQALAPGPLFDPVAYLVRYSELGMEPDLLGHYLQTGIREAREAFPLRYV